MATIYEEALEQFDQEVKKMEQQDNTTVTVDENGQEVKKGFQKTFENKEEARVVIDTLEALGYGDNYD